MSNAVKDNTSYAVEIEDVAGVYEAPSSASKFVQTLKDGAEIVPAQELLQRDIFTGSIGRVQSRVGTRSVSGSMPVEFRAAEVEGAAPEIDALMTSAMGSKKVRAAVTTKTGNTSTVLQLEDADVTDFAVHDIVMVKEAGNYQFSWVQSVDDSEGSASITLGLALDGAPDDNVEIAAVTQYSTAESGHPSLSITKYVETTMQERAIGCRVTSMALENFTTGQIPNLNFGFEGLTWDTVLSARPFVPEYDSSLPPIALRACLHQDGVKVQVNDVSVSLENTLGFVTSTCSANGRISSRVTSREVSGSFNPYVDPNSVAQFTRFKTNVPYSLFMYAFNPDLDNDAEFTGELANGVAILMPSCITTELGASDADGILQHDVSFEANRGSGNVEELKIAFF
jgi:hypothetical protein